MKETKMKTLRKLSIDTLLNKMIKNLNAQIANPYKLKQKLLIVLILTLISSGAFVMELEAFQGSPSIPAPPYHPPPLHR